jgi:hypothetical protein
MPERVKNGQTALERRLRFTFDISPVGAVEQRAGILRSATLLLGGDSEQNARFVKCESLRDSELSKHFAEVMSSGSYEITCLYVSSH